jgi:hypothetical protein
VEEERIKKSAKWIYNSYADTLYEGWWNDSAKENSILMLRTINNYEDYRYYSVFSPIMNPSLNKHTKQTNRCFLKSYEKEQSTPDHPFRQKDGGQVIPSSCEEGKRRCCPSEQGWWNDSAKEYSILIFS